MTVNQLSEYLDAVLRKGEAFTIIAKDDCDEYVVYVCDAENINKATHVWKFVHDRAADVCRGLYSSSGINGTFQMAY